MTRTTNTNYSAADATLGDIAFQVADSDNDLFDRFDVAKLGKALDVHTHDGVGKGLGILAGTVSQHASTNSVGAPTTTSTTSVDIDATNLSVTITPTVGTRLLVLVTGSVIHNTAGAYTAVAIRKDSGTDWEPWVMTSPTNGGYCSFGGADMWVSTAGVSTTFRLRWKVSTGMATLQLAEIAVVELKK